MNLVVAQHGQFEYVARGTRIDDLAERLEFRDGAAIGPDDKIIFVNTRPSSRGSTTHALHIHGVRSIAHLEEFDTVVDLFLALRFDVIVATGCARMDRLLNKPSEYIHGNGVVQLRVRQSRFDTSSDEPQQFC